MTKFEKLDNELTVPIIDQNGVTVGDPLNLRNVPIVELYPNEPVCVIDWIVADSQRPDEDEIRVPVPYNGQMLFGLYAWGSAVKRGQTIGLVRDVLVQDGPLTEVERAIKAGRMLLGQGIYGGLKGTFTIDVLAEGVKVGSNWTADGQGMIRRSVALAGYNGADKIRLGRGKQSYQMWQRLPWSAELQAELKPIIDETLHDLAISHKWLRDHKDATWDEKKALTDLDPERMILHPYIAGAISRASGEDMFRVATTVDIPTSVRIAVATHAVKRAAVVGRHTLVRYPVDANGSIQAVEGYAEKEAARIAELEVIQHCLASKKAMANGTLIVVDDDEMPEGVDIVLCVDDIKMGSKAHGRREVEGVLAFNQWFDAGSAMGVNPEWARERMGLDYDGDLVFDYAMTEFPKTYAAVEALPPQETPKLMKSHHRIKTNDRRAVMAVNSMCNIVGFATNMMSSTFAVADRIGLAKEMGYRSLEELDYHLNRLIKIGTDGFKTMEWDREKTQKQLVFLQKAIRLALSRSAPWTRWKRSEWAFRRGVPEFYAEDNKPGDKITAMNWVPSFFDGTVAQICRLTLPSLKAILGVPIEQKPLSAYRNWALPVDEFNLAVAHEMQMRYNGRAKRTNWQDPNEVKKFRMWWQDELRNWTETMELTNLEASALWREAHSAKSDEASGASVFIGFPEECRWIIREKPGKNKPDTETLVLGLQYVFDQEPEHLTCEVEVREFEQVKNGKRLIRKVVCGNVPGKKDAREPYPADLIGMVEVKADQPELGKYIAVLTASGHGKSWHCKLMPVREEIATG